MRVQFLNLGVVLLLVGAILGVYWINSSLSQNTIGSGMALPIDQGGQGLYFYAPTSGSTTFTLSYLYADSNASVTLWRCTTSGSTCGVAPIALGLSMPETTVALGSPITISLTEQGAVAPYTYNYTGLPPGCVSANQGNLTCTPRLSGTYSAIAGHITDARGISSTARAPPLVVSGTGINAPVLDISVTESAITGSAPFSTSFTASVTGGVPPYNYTWSFGDSSGSSYGASVSHTYTKPGSYAATVSVTDSASGFPHTNQAGAAVTALATNLAPAPVGPLMSLNGAKGTNSAVEPTTWAPGVPGYPGPSSDGQPIDYAVLANEPLVVVVKVPQTLPSLGVEGASIGLLAIGGGLTVASFFLADPSHRPSPRIAQLKRTLYFFFQNKLAVVGLAILVFFVIIAVIAPLLAPYQPSYYLAGDPNSGNGYANSLPQQCVIAAGSYSVLSCYDNPQPVCSPDGFPPSPPAACTQGDVLQPVSGWYGNIIYPTWNTSNILNPGVMPMGSLVTDKGQPGGGYMINIYQGLVRATPWDLFFSSVIVLSGASIGIVLGSMAGYLGGMFDEALMRLTDIFLSIPGLLLTIVVLIAIRSANANVSFNEIIFILMGSFIITWWPGYTRLVRGQVLVTREQKYVEAARAAGAGSGRIIRSHIIPNSVYPVFVQISLDVGSVPLLLGALAFLGFNQAIGFGTPLHGLPTFPEWGGMAAAGVGEDFISALVTNTGGNPVPFPWWQFLFPGLALFLFAIAVNFLSDGLRDALDPRLRR